MCGLLQAAFLSISRHKALKFSQSNLLTLSSSNHGAAPAAVVLRLLENFHQKIYTRLHVTELEVKVTADYE